MTGRAGQKQDTRLRVHKAFTDWTGLSLDSPDAVLAEFKQQLSAVAASEAGAAIAYLPEAGSIPDLAVDRMEWGSLVLAGVPFLVKDLYDVAGWPTAASSKFLAREYGIPSITSPFVKKLFNLGATPVGKTHLNEFAYGLSGRNLHFGNCPHPHFPERLTGGSSSGSAWAVGKGIVPLALGTDTGGSVRVPAAFCGIYGIRLTPDDWSRSGCFPLSPSFDTAGWFTATKEDMKTAVRLMLDPSPSGDSPGGVLLEPADLSFTPDLKAEYSARLDALDLQGDPSITDRFHAATEDLPRHYSILQSWEAFKVHERWLDRYRDQYNPVVWQRIDRGRRWSGSEIEAAEKARRRLSDFFDRLFESHDYAVLPATTMPAPAEDQLTESFRNHILTLTTPASMAALPVLTAPVFMESGLSGGLQIIYRDPKSDLPLKFLDKWECT